MAWSIQIARVFGIPIRLHFTFVLLLAFLAFVGFRAGDGMRVWFALGLFACVLLHELGHSVAALRYGVKVEDITLLPIGGLARMSSIPREPVKELVIAIAGPAVNFVLAPLLHLLHLALEPDVPAIDALVGQGFLLEQLALTNLTLGLFNLLPAFPMDGGRILRALLATRMSHARATQHAAQLGQLVAFALGFLGLFVQPWLILIALFVFVGAGQEAGQAQTQEAVEGMQVWQAVVTQFQSLRRANTVGDAVDLLLAGAQQDFPVMEDGEVVGIVTRKRLLEVLYQSGRGLYVSEVMEPAPEAVEADEPLEPVLQRMVEHGWSVVPVRRNGRLVGLLTMDNLVEFVMVRRAMLLREEAGQPG